jgi:hypothetical protein
LSKANKGVVGQAGDKGKQNSVDVGPDLPPELAIFDKALIEKIEADIIHQGSAISFDDIAGLMFAKKCVNELICW